MTRLAAIGAMFLGRNALPVLDACYKCGHPTASGSHWKAKQNTESSWLQLWWSLFLGVESDGMLAPHYTPLQNERARLGQTLGRPTFAKST